MNGHCDAIQILSESRLSKTPHRISVLEVLIRAERLLSAAEIADVMDRTKGINKVTIYRMLTTFKRAGIVREIATQQGVKHYEIACRHNPVHPHFYCVKCRTLACLSEIDSPAYQKWLKGFDFEADCVSIHISGVCAQCHGKE